MKPEDFQKKTTEIVANLSDQAKVTSLLTELADAYTSTHTTNESLNTSVEQKEEEIGSLKKTNMNLFEKVAMPTTTEKLTDVKPLEYDDLLKDMGGNE